MHRLDYHRFASIPSSSKDDLLVALRQLAGGVTIVTAMCNDRPHGMTVTAFNSVSLDPLVVMASISRSSRISKCIFETEHFVVNILAADQEELAQRFALPVTQEERFAGVDLDFAVGGSPRIDGSLAWIDCALVQTLEIGTHTVMFGRVLAADGRTEAGDPLVYFHREYRRLGAHRGG